VDVEVARDEGYFNNPIAGEDVEATVLMKRESPDKIEKATGWEEMVKPVNRELRLLFRDEWECDFCGPECFCDWVVEGR
jgi:hypothetical protein